MGLKAKLRAWLIELVREAIRIERASIQPIRSTAPASPISIRAVDAVVKQAISSDFEQMQAESIKAQEKYYAPE